MRQNDNQTTGMTVRTLLYCGYSTFMKLIIDNKTIVHSIHFIINKDSDRHNAGTFIQQHNRCAQYPSKH